MTLKKLHLSTVNVQITKIRLIFQHILVYINIPNVLVFVIEDISYKKSSNQSHSQTDIYYGASHAVDRDTSTCSSTYKSYGISNMYSLNIQCKDYKGFCMGFFN